MNRKVVIGVVFIGLGVGLFAVGVNREKLLSYFRSNNNLTSMVIGVATTPSPVVVRPVRYSGEEGKTVLQILREKVATAEITGVQTTESSLGEYVQAINGVVGGTSERYWLFYVNGEMAQVGADVYVTKTSDLIEWRFE